VSEAIDKAIAILEAGRGDALKALDALSVNRLGAAVKELRALSRRHWNPVYNTDPVQRACGDLPEGWEIEISLELGSGSVYLIDPTGERIDIEHGGECFDWAIHEAIDAAIASLTKPADGEINA
jgi:hypothetical protein